MTATARLQAYIAEINDILCTVNLLQWDARTQMPVGGAATRGHQMATLTKLAADRVASPALGRLLAAAEAEAQDADPDSYAARGLRQIRAAHAIAVRTPPDLAERMAGLRALAQQAWIQARRTDDFAHFAPHLREIVAGNRAVAAAIGYDHHPYDAMLLRYEPGMTAARLAQLFDELKAGILPLLSAVVAQGDAVPWSFLTRGYRAEAQAAFGLEIAAAFGYDLQRGRLDETVHPFEISFTREDVRITSRYREDFLPAALFGIFHEAGHALYEQGVDPALTRSALTTDLLGLYAVGGASFGAHESQSRLWENQVGRSAAFWAQHFPRLCEFFPEQLAGVSWQQFHRAVNRVQPSLIRVEADEVTYSLHIMLRTEIEMALMAGELAVDELPAVWNQKMQEYLGVVPDRDSQGVLQDIHWSHGYIGSFPTYTIGNIMAAQFFAAARAAVPGLDDSLARGEYRPLLNWLTEHVYRHGRAYSPDELLQRATGAALTTEPYLHYLRAKFGALYAL